MHIYIAEFMRGTATLAKAKVKKETPKIYILSHKRENIIGHLYSGMRTLQKNGKQLRSFESEHDAVCYLNDCAERHIVFCQDELSVAKSQADKLAARVREFEKVTK